MPNTVAPFSFEQTRVVINLRQAYDNWIEARRAERSLPYAVRWKTVNGADYLYRIHDRDGNGTSLGRRSAETEGMLRSYLDEKASVEERVLDSGLAVAEITKMWRPLRLPLVHPMAARLLLEADLRGLLGKSVMVVGTNAMLAYWMEASGRIKDASVGTDDFDMTWRESSPVEGTPLRDLLRAVDPTFTQNTERSFQARNRHGYEFDILAAPSTIMGVSRRDMPRPIPLPEQEWLMLGTPVSAVLVGSDGTPAPMTVPDPRWFALQKLWMSRQEKRMPSKRAKDELQGMVLLSAIVEAMPHYPIDAEFEASLPSELQEHYARWKTHHDATPPSGDTRPTWMKR